MWNISFILTHSQNTQYIRNAQPKFSYNVKTLTEIAQDKEFLQQFSIIYLTFIQRNQVSLIKWCSYVTHLITNLIQHSPTFQITLLWVNTHNIRTQIRQQYCTYLEEILPTSWKFEILLLNGITFGDVIYSTITLFFIYNMEEHFLPTFQEYQTH